MMQFEYSLKGTYVPTEHREEMNQVFLGQKLKDQKRHADLSHARNLKRKEKKNKARTLTKETNEIETVERK